MISKRISLVFRKGFLTQYVSSNKLARAIIKNSIELYSPEIIKTFIEKPFATSDLLPFIYLDHSNSKEFLLPKPFYPLVLGKEDSKINLKSFKKAKYITENAFNCFLGGEQINLSQFSVSNEIIGLKSEHFKFQFVTHSQPRNFLNRVVHLSESNNEEDSSQFFFSEISDIKNGGFYFILTAHEEIINILLNSIKLLQHRGLGGDISSGFGCFQMVDIEDYSLENEENEQKILLSHWIPGKKDMESKIKIVYYNLESYKPIALTKKNIPISLKETKMIKSGSILKNVNRHIIGTYKNIGFKKDPSFSWGFAITKGVKK